VREWEDWSVSSDNYWIRHCSRYNFVISLAIAMKYERGRVICQPSQISGCPHFRESRSDSNCFPVFVLIHQKRLQQKNNTYLP